MSNTAPPEYVYTIHQSPEERLKPSQKPSSKFSFFLKDLKIKTLLIGILLIVSFISISSIGYLSFINARNALEEVASNHLETAAQSRAHAISWILEEQLDKIRVAATHSELSTEELKEIRDINKEFQEVFVLDSDGIVITSSDESQIGRDKSGDDYFINVKEEGYIKDAYFSETSGEHSIAVSTPHVGGILVARIYLDVFEEFTLEKSGLGETGESYLINKDSYMITPSRFIPEKETFLKLKVNTVNSQHCFGDHVSEEHNRARIFPDYRGISALGTHVYIPEMDWCLLAEIDEKEAFSSAYELRNLILIVGVGIFILMILLGSLVGRFISKPIETLHEGVGIIERGNLDHKVGFEGGGEVGELSRAFDKMTNAVKESRADVDKKIAQQTEELNKQHKKTEESNVALEKMNSVMTGRELKMMELKERLAELSKK